MPARDRRSGRAHRRELRAGALLRAVHGRRRRQPARRRHRKPGAADPLRAARAAPASPPAARRSISGRAAASPTWSTSPPCRTAPSASVPTPALVAPIEFTLPRADYAALGGYMDRDPTARRRAAPAAATSAWPRDRRRPAAGRPAAPPARPDRPALPRLGRAGRGRAAYAQAARRLRRGAAGAMPSSSRLLATPLKPSPLRDEVAVKLLAARASPIARRATIVARHASACTHAAGFITPMAAVAGAVADHMLAAMSRGRRSTAPSSTTAATSPSISRRAGAALRPGCRARRAGARRRLHPRRASTPPAASPPPAAPARAAAAAASRSASPTAVTVLARTAAAGRRRGDRDRQRRRPARPPRRRPGGRPDEIDPDTDLGARLDHLGRRAALPAAETDAALDAGAASRRCSARGAG